MGLKEWLKKRKEKADKEPKRHGDIMEAPTTGLDPEPPTPEPDMEDEVDVEEVAKSGGEVTDTKDVKRAKELLEVLSKLENMSGKLSIMIREQYKVGQEYPAEVYVGIQKALEEIANQHTKEKHKIDYPSFTFGIGYCLREVMAEVLELKKQSEKKQTTNYIS